ncbi:MAG: hypothetical protein Q9213_007554 [Squamulea squamosa]
MDPQRPQQLSSPSPGPSQPSRRYGDQPPTLLNTSFAVPRPYNLAFPSGSQTPLSTTSLSTPFSAFPLSACSLSNSAEVGSSSPMATRSRPNFNAPYNPQHWGPLSSSSSSPLEEATRNRHTSQSNRSAPFAPRLLGPDEPIASPPPPYSPRRDGTQHQSPLNPHDTTSPSDTISPSSDPPSQHATPVSAATTMSPDLTCSYSSRQSPPPSRSHALEDSHAYVPAVPAFPPPPAAGQASGSRTRPSSKTHAERLLSTLGSKRKTQNTSTPTSAIDTLQANTAQALAQSPELHAGMSGRAPASRRAASTGGIGLSGPSSCTTSRSPSQSRWEPGMPLPPPPAGPPPTAARSQSLNRSSESLSSDRLSASTSTTGPRSRRPPGNGTALAPVPPTPADWKEEAPNTSRSYSQAPLHIDTGNIIRSIYSNNDDPSTAVSVDMHSAHPHRDSSCGALTRSPAVRNRSAKGIRERRSESRNGIGRLDTSAAIQSSTITMSPQGLENVKPTDLILPLGNSTVSRRRTVNRISPTSGKDMLSLDETLHSPLVQETPGQSVLFSSSNTTPQPEHTSRINPGRTTAPAPAFSPTKVDSAPIGRARASPTIAPTTLSRQSPQPWIDTQSSSSLDVPLGLDKRPISHLLHIPNSNESIQEPLLPSAQKSRRSIPDLLGPESPKAFAQRAVERHRNFAEREAAASSDSERLDLFVQFMLAESRIRREQYAAVFAEEEIAISELTQGLFERQLDVHSFGEIQDASGIVAQATPLRDSRTSSISNSVSESNWHRSSSVASRNHESPISISTDCSSQNRPESSWWNDYVPCLSPIASMSIVTGHDQEEVGSRGRASSRWWEDKPDGSANGDAFSVLKKSKRESKYMGLPREARNAPALFETIPIGSSNRIPGCDENSTQTKSYGPHEYPPEKGRWHHQSSPLPPPPPNPPTPHSAPYTPDLRRLDISRFVTLPPPYPRHHPAVNNSHPDLANVRAVVRSLHATEDADAIRDRYVAQIGEKRQRANSWRQHQRSLHDQDIKFRMNHEDLSQAEFDQAEQELDARLHKSEKDLAQTDFDLFQNVVVSPLHSLFAERTAKANSTIEELSGRLFSDAQKPSPNAAQEEGDEQPELLEKLTQLKWLFEARETLHRKTYDLLSERNDRYRAIVLLPYQQANNHEKCVEAQSFFANDARDRKMTFENEVSSRFDAFLTVIEANVTRGVEIQLSAFWDIAPPLHRVLSRVPNNLSGFEIQIPADEYVENPDYYEHPLQYLYSLLSHAQKSTYQFIESQINLLCLLHEIKSAAMNARYQAEENRSPHGACVVDEGRRREEARLTEDLKEKVGVVEGQWEEALGEELMAVRERVRCWLLENGGWDDENDEVNLSGRNTNPFAATVASKQASSTQTTQHTVAHAHAERLHRHLERQRPPAAGIIQRSWRGYRSRRQTKHSWRQDWDIREGADSAAEGRGPPATWTPTPYKSEEDCLDQLKLLVHFASPQEQSDGDRLILFARRYASYVQRTGSAVASDAWTFPLLRLAKLSISMLKPFKLRSHSDLNVLLELLSTVTAIIPHQIASVSRQYFEALRGVASDSQGVYDMQGMNEKHWGEAIVAPLRPTVPNTATTYEAFASQILRLAGIPQDALEQMLNAIRVKDLVLAMGNPLSLIPRNKMHHSMNREELLWLVAYFIYFYRTANPTKEGSSDAVYISVLSKYVSLLAVDIASRVDAPTNISSAQINDSTFVSTDVPPPLPPFVQKEILSLISQRHVSGLLAQAAAPTDLAVNSEHTSELAVYALTLLRAFPRKGDEIRMWLYFGSTSRKDIEEEVPIPAIKYYYKAASQTSIYEMVRNDPNSAMVLLNPGTRRRVTTNTLPDRDKQWQVILLFLELYPIVLKVMDDEEFLTGAISADKTESWTRQSALALDQVQDLTLFLKNLAFSMYWNASEIAGVEEPETKSSIASYFSGNLTALSDNHPDGRSIRTQDATIADLPWMTLSYMKGMVTGLLRMIYERDSRRKFLPSDHWLMTRWFEMDRFVPAVVQEEEEKHKIQQSYEPDGNGEAEGLEDGFEEEETHENLVGTQRVQQVRNVERLRRQQKKASRRKYLESVTPRLEILQNMPFFIPFSTRVQAFRQFVLLDQIRRRNTADPDLWRFSMMSSNPSHMGRHRAKVHRESIFDDAFDQYYSLGDGLKEPIQIAFVDKFDTVEEGIDGGGVTKEFLTSVTSEAFNSMNGLDMFVENDHHLLYPNPTALDERKELLRQAGEPEGSQYWNESTRDLLRRFEFMGRIIGKCLYEGILVDIHFAPFFLLKWALTGGQNFASRESSYQGNINDLRDLDEALYQGLLQLKNYPGEVENMGLTFEVTDTLFPSDRPSSYHPSQAPIPRTRELVPGGSNTPVTNKNRLVYISKIARHRLFIQPHAQTSAFLKGLSTIIDPAWLSMFNQHEIQTLISGTDSAPDIADLRSNTLYGGLYSIGDDGLEHPTIQLFWNVVLSLAVEDKMKLLKFVTSTPRAPLLGFGNLNPKFSIRDGGNDQTRLPTTSTCVNLLKLPVYKDEGVLRERLLYSIRSGAGFNLS